MSVSRVAPNEPFCPAQAPLHLTRVLSFQIRAGKHSPRWATGLTYQDERQVGIPHCRHRGARRAHYKLLECQGCEWRPRGPSAHSYRAVDKLGKTAALRARLDLQW
jgi:ribosomal protein L37AE/L43A